MNPTDFEALYEKAKTMTEEELREVVSRFIAIAEFSPKELKASTLIRGLNTLKD